MISSRDQEATEAVCIPRSQHGCISCFHHTLSTELTVRFYPCLSLEASSVLFPLKGRFVPARACSILVCDHRNLCVLAESPRPQLGPYWLLSLPRLQGELADALCWSQLPCRDARRQAAATLPQSVGLASATESPSKAWPGRVLPERKRPGAVGCSPLSGSLRQYWVALGIRSLEYRGL